MHRAAFYLSSKFTPKVKKVVVESYQLTTADAAAVSASLPLDANDYYYSACMSIVDALRAMDVGFYTWSTVKMYYSVFYSLRAILAWDNVVVFQPEEAGPYRVAARTGEMPAWVTGKGSHQQMLNCFRQLNPGHYLISQNIDLLDPLDWLYEKRTDANYVIPRFSEPEVPDHYVTIVKVGLRKAIGAYLDPSQAILTFDKDHAIVSFPLAALRFWRDSAGKVKEMHAILP